MAAAVAVVEAVAVTVSAVAKAAHYITTPIYYVNDVPHLGHAYTTIAADTLARYWRAQGEPTWFLTGTDEHGQKIAKTAAERGLSPQGLADEVVTRFQALWTRFGSSHDDFIRTTEPRHKSVVQALWQRLEATGDIYLGGYEGYYCVADEAYYTEKELVGGMSPTGRPVELVQEPSYFFRLSKYQEPLLRWLDEHKPIAPASRLNEVRSFVAGGLKDLSISRTRVDWGVPVPGNPEHTVYVWLDALTNYLSALGGLDSPRAQQFWPSVTHLIGKDILRFHAVYWPAFLMSAQLPLPQKIFAHGWWTIEGQKMSKTTRNVVDPHSLIDAYGVDAVRYFVLREVPFGDDGDFSHRALMQRFNADLANDLGNVVNRVDGMIRRYFEAVVPTQDADQVLLGQAQAMHAHVRTAMQDVAFHRALEAIFAVISEANQYVERSAPWKLHKAGDLATLGTVLRTLAEVCTHVGQAIAPFMPATSERIAAWLPLSGPVAGRTLGELSPLFPRMDAQAIQKKLDEVERTMSADAPAPAAESAVPTGPEPLKAEIEYPAFDATDLRVGLIVKAEDLPKSDKLLRLEVDLGEGKPRQILAGIKLYFKPETLVGRRVVVVANLKPRKMMGLESHGMVLAASDPRMPDQLRLVDPGDMVAGGRVK